MFFFSFKKNKRMVFSRLYPSKTIIYQYFPFQTLFLMKNQMLQLSKKKALYDVVEQRLIRLKYMQGCIFYPGFVRAAPPSDEVIGAAAIFLL